MINNFWRLQTLHFPPKYQNIHLKNNYYDENKTPMKFDENKKVHKNIIFKRACISIRYIESNLRSWNKLNWNLSLGIFILQTYRLPEWFSDSISSSLFLKTICYFGLFLPLWFQVLRACNAQCIWIFFLILARAIWINDVIVGALKYRFMCFMCSFSCNQSNGSNSTCILYISLFSIWILIFFLYYKLHEKRFWISINLLFSNSRFYLSGILIPGISFIVLHMLILVQLNPIWYTATNEHKRTICGNENEISHPPSVVC